MINLLPKQLFLLDPLAIFFLAVICIVSIPSAIFSIGYMQGEGAGKKVFSWALLTIFVFSMCLVVVSGNLISFLIFWEAMSLASYFLVVFDYKHEKSIRAGTIYLIMTHAGTACLMAAFFMLYNHSGSFDYTAVKESLSSMPLNIKNITFLLLFIGFATKAGMVPLHIWLPFAHPQAPSHVSSIMSGVMIKIAVFGMLRFFLTLFSQYPAWYGALLMIFGIASCLVGIIYALMEKDLKKLLAYSSVENIGIIIFCLGAAMLLNSIGVAVLSALILCAGLYHLINHALFKGLLFLCSGSIYKSTGLRDMEKMGGLIKSMPSCAILFLIGAMGISALPPFNGFVSELLAFQALFSAIAQLQGMIKILMILSVSALVLTSALAASCFVKAFGIAFLGLPRSVQAKETEEASSSMKAGMAILASGVIMFGIAAAIVAPLILRISSSLLGAECSDAPLKIISIAPPIIAAAFIALWGIAFLLFKFVLRTKKVRYNTWDCGYYNLDSRNEYTATAFSKPFRIAFSFFLLPYRKSEKIRDSFYHVRKFTYGTYTTPIFRRYFYEPLARFVYSVALGMRRLQPGSIHIYIAYIFITLVVLLAIAVVF